MRTCIEVKLLVDDASNVYTLKILRLKFFLYSSSHDRSALSQAVAIRVVFHRQRPN